MAIPYIKQVVQVTATTSSADTAFVTTAPINVGDQVIIAIGRTALSTTTNGALSAATSAGALTAIEKIGTACRASTFDVHQTKQRCTTTIPTGSTITLTDRSATTKRGAVLYVVGGLQALPAAAHSGNTADNTAGNVSGGQNGSSLTETASTTTDPGEEYTMLCVAWSYGGTDVLTPDPAFTVIGSARTTSGSADRGIYCAYKLVSVSGSQIASAGRDSSGSWAAALGCLLYLPFSPALMDFDSMTEGAAPTFTAPWSQLTTSTATLVKAAAAKHGAKGLNIDVNAGGYTQIKYDEDANQEQRVVSAYIRPKTANAAAIYPLLARVGGTLGTGIGDVRINADGTVAIRNVSTAVATSVVSLVRDGSKWYRFEWMLKAGSGGQELRVYDGESSTPLFTLTGAMTSTEHTTYTFGSVTYDATSAIDIDTLRVGADWLGPFAATSGPQFKEWNGTSWITLTPKEWNGTAWMTVNPKEL